MIFKKMNFVFFLNLLGFKLQVFSFLIFNFHAALLGYL